MKSERTDATAKMVGIKSGIIFDSRRRCFTAPRIDTVTPY